MNQLIKIILVAFPISLTNAQAVEKRVQDFLLDDHTVYEVPVSGARVTTISFPSAIAAVDAALTTADGKTPGVFQIAHTKGTAYLSVRALAKDATTNLNVRWNNRTYRLRIARKRGALVFRGSSISTRQKQSHSATADASAIDRFAR